MTPRRPSAALGFAGWTVAGAGICLGLLTGFTIGIFVLALTALLVGALLAAPGERDGGAVGLVSGAGLVPLYVAYLNRAGPGEVCTRTRAEQRCEEMWNPWPWLAAGIFLVVLGVVLFTRQHRTPARRQPRPPVSRP